MNPTLLHHHTPAFELPPSTDIKYLSQDRTLSNASTLASNDFPSFYRNQRGIVTNSRPTSFDNNHQQPLSDAPYHTSNNPLLLSPPDSLIGPSPAGGNSQASPFANSTLPKPLLSNVSASDHFTAGTGGVLSSHWNDTSMTLRLPPTLSPPNSYSANGIANGFLHSRPIMDHRTHTYHPSTSYNTPYGATSMRSFHRPGSYTQYSTTDSIYSNSAMPMHQHEVPRSEGPPFGDTQLLHEVVSARNQSLQPEISANIQKGFFQVEGKWTCYRRNYFTVQCSFTLLASWQEGQCFLQRNGQADRIREFGISISAKTAAVNSQESETRGLVQHTPKRDKATESVPTRHVVQPASTHYQHPNGAVGIPQNLMHGSQPSMAVLGGPWEDPNSPTVPTQYTFERIQFQKATANNGKRRAQQQYFHVVVELSANISRDNYRPDWVLVATKESEHMVVRGRSPGHYKDGNRRDSLTSNGDGDRGTGGGYDGSGLPSSYGSSHHSSMDWNSTQNHPHQHHHSHSHHHNYRGSSYQSYIPSEESPPSATSSTTLTGSPTDPDCVSSDGDQAKSPSSYYLDRSRLSPPRQYGSDGVFVSRKRTYEEALGEAEPTFQVSSVFGEQIPSSNLDFPDFSLQPKVLCASS